jgi:hypothetical protein
MEAVVTTLSSLWLPVLVSSALVFIASSLIHMVFSAWHRNDYTKVPAEDRVMDALRSFAIPPGDYLVPCPSGPQDMGSPEFVEKMKRGPVMVLTIMPSATPWMGRSLALWFVYCAVVSFFAAYIASRALAPGADYLRVFQFVGATAFIGYTLALWQMSIWYARAWSTTLKSTIDGLVYALLTAGVFGWLWPN